MTTPKISMFKNKILVKLEVINVEVIKILLEYFLKYSLKTTQKSKQ